MANRYLNQFMYSLQKKPVLLQGSAVFNAAIAASKIVQDLTYLADLAGTAGNSITIAYTAGAVAGSEVVSVVGNAISVQISTGVSTATQVKAAVDADVTASALISVSISGTAGTAQVTAAAVNLAGGTDNTFSPLSFSGVDSITYNSAGDYTVNITDKYTALLGFSAVIESATSQDRIWQVDSNAVVASKALGLRCLAAATPTNPVTLSKIYFEILLSNSSIT